MTGAAMTGESRSDRGAGTVLMLAVITAAVTVLALISVTGQLVVAQHRARAAADLAALAGAAALAAGGDGCRAALRVAAANQSRLAGCAIGSGGVIAVRVRAVDGAGGGRVSAMARAGPGP